MKFSFIITKFLQKKRGSIVQILLSYGMISYIDATQLISNKKGERTYEESTD